MKVADQQLGGAFGRSLSPLGGVSRCVSPAARVSCRRTGGTAAAYSACQDLGRYKSGISPLDVGVITTTVACNLWCSDNSPPVSAPRRPTGAARRPGAARRTTVDRAPTRSKPRRSLPGFPALGDATPTLAASRRCDRAQRPSVATACPAHLDGGHRPIPATGHRPIPATGQSRQPATPQSSATGHRKQGCP